jgi:hypothetical protein
MDPTDSTNATDPTNGVEFLDWTVNLVENGNILSKPTSEIESLPTGTTFSVTGVVKNDGYIYVIQAKGPEFAVLFPASGQVDVETADASLRFPTADQNFVAPMDGAVFVVNTDRVMTSTDWKSLFPVRDLLPPKDRGPRKKREEPKDAPKNDPPRQG